MRASGACRELRVPAPRRVIQARHGGQPGRLAAAPAGRGCNHHLLLATGMDQTKHKMTCLYRDKILLHQYSKIVCYTQY